jgi:hypothetical protein
MESQFEKLLVDLVRGRVDFIVVGGIAVALNGIVRTTDDLDIIVDAAQPNIERLLQTLSRVGEGHARELSIADFNDEEGAVRVIEDFPIDIFVRMTGLRYVDLLPWRHLAVMGECEVPYLAAEGLIRLKERSFRKRDQDDVRRLRALTTQTTPPSRLLGSLTGWLRRLVGRGD